MKKETKQLKQLLKNLPMLKAPEGFTKRLKEKIKDLDRPEWDQVQFED
jgi:hypothetical protein